mgnify:FL=1
MKKKNFRPVSEERLFRHFLPGQRKKKELNPDEFPVESEECTKKLIHAVNHTPSIPLDAAFLPPLL